MALLHPFRGLRYDLDKVGSFDVVCAPPYDVIDEREKKRLLDLSPFNSVRLILPDDEGELDRFRAAARTLHDWIEAGILRAEDRPVLYVYRMRYEHPARGVVAITGVICAASIAVDGVVVPHERTLSKPLGEQLGLLEHTRANLSPIYLLSVPPDGASDAVSSLAASELTFLGSWSEVSGVEHAVWRVDDTGSIDEFVEKTADNQLVIADGHHRFQVAREFHLRTRDPGSDLIMALVVDVEEAAHAVEGTHRLLAPAAGLDESELLTRLERVFGPLERTDPEPSTLYSLLEEGRVGLVLRGSHDAEGATASPRLQAWAVGPAASSDNATDLEALPAAVLHRDVLFDVAGTEIAFEPSLEESMRSVLEGSSTAAVLLPPPPLRAIVEVARSPLLLPQKSTYFFPKPRTGAVFRLIDLP